jgi:hypothetical protein
VLYKDSSRFQMNRADGRHLVGERFADVNRVAVGLWYGQA